MKNLIALLCFIFISASAHSQTVCYIKYSYDASGNRISREFVCGTLDTIINLPNGGGGNNNRQVKPVPAAMSSFDFDFTLVPNPVSNTATVLISNYKEDLLCTIFDPAGKVLHQFSVMSSTINVNVSTYAAGTYFVMIQSPTTKRTRKFVKV
jgi:Secretion system C-terminal sorting domain